MTRLEIIKAAFKNANLFREIPFEVLDDLEKTIISEWYKQSKIIDTPTLESVSMNLLAQNISGMEPLLEGISHAKDIDTASQEIVLFGLRTEAQTKIVQQLSVLITEGNNTADIEALYTRLEELRTKKDIQVQLPVNAKNYKALVKAEESEIYTMISWLTDNKVPIKKKVLYSFIATTNGGKTILKTWFAYELLRVGQNVLYLAQEEPYSDTIRRIYQAALGLTEDAYADMTRDGFDEVGELFRKVSDERGYGNFYAVEWPGVQISSVRQYLKRHKEQYNESIDAVIVDYGKLVETSTPKKNYAEWERIGQIFKELKEMAMKEDIIVVTSVQLNKEASKLLAEKGQTAGLYDVAGAYEAMHHVNYVFSVRLKILPTDKLTVNYYDSNRFLGAYTLTVQKSKYGNLKEGDSGTFLWLADHTLDYRKVKDIEIPNAL